MEVNYDGHANKSGVYKITNRINGKVYIGSAKLFKVRVSQHKSSLKNNKHSNKYLQASWNKHGAAAFLFEVLEVVSGDKVVRTTKEQKYIDAYKEKWKMCYNLVKKTIRSEGPWSSTPEKTRRLHSEASKRRMTTPEGKKQILEAMAIGQKTGYTKGMKRPHTEETKKKISQAHVGKKTSEETKEKMSEARKGKTWEEIYGPEEAARLRKNASERMSGENSYFYGKNLEPWNKGKTGYKVAPCSEERKRAISRGNKGKVCSEETKRKIAKSVSRKNKELWQDPEYRRKTIQGRIGKTHSEVTKAKISAAHKGKPKSKAHKQALCEAWKRRKAKQLVKSFS